MISGLLFWACIIFIATKIYSKLHPQPKRIPTASVELQNQSSTSTMKVEDKLLEPKKSPVPAEKKSAAPKEQEILPEKVVLPPETGKVKQIVWDKIPTEQGLKIGDWITIEGYPAGLIGAEAISKNGVVTGYKWNEANALFGDMAMIVIASQPIGYSVPADRIVNIVGFVKKPSSNRGVQQANEAYIKKWDTPEGVLIRVSGEISRISSPDPTNRYPDQWGVDLEAGLSVEFVE